jgi:hypothetical protein
VNIEKCGVFFEGAMQNASFFGNPTAPAASPANFAEFKLSLKKKIGTVKQKTLK